MSYYYRCVDCEKVINASLIDPSHDEIVMKDVGKNTWVFKCLACGLIEENKQ